MKERFREGKVDSNWKKRKFFKNRELQIEEVEKKREKQEEWYDEMKCTDKERQRKKVTKL